MTAIIFKVYPCMEFLNLIYGFAQIKAVSQEYGIQCSHFHIKQTYIVLNKC